MNKEKEILTTAQLSVGYGKKEVLTDVMLSLHPGEIMAVIGPNGCGKSTLLKTLMRELQPLCGTVYLEEKDLSHYKEKELAKKLSMVSTKRVHPGMMTCKEVVESGRYPYTGPMGMLSEKDKEIVAHTMLVTKTSDLAEKDIETVSDGQRQRVMLARALCQEPEILILDEPTTFLDIRYKLEFFDVLKRLAKEREIGVIISLHELSYVEKVADTVVCMKDHRIDRITSAQNFFSLEYLCNLFGGEEALYEKYTSLQREAFVYKGQKKLKLGYTTGSCATAGAMAGAKFLLAKERMEEMMLETKDGQKMPIPIDSINQTGKDCVMTSVKKNAGDDTDITDNMDVITTVTLIKEGIVIRGGKGVGIATKPGLNQPVGEAAINDGPRKMIAQVLRDVADENDYTGGFWVEISIPHGEEIAKKTFNPRLGIEGGLSVLGSTGLVEPMSEVALLETIRTEISVKTAGENKNLLLTPGNYGRDFAKEAFAIDLETGVKCSNFIGEAIDMAVSYGAKKVLLIGHIGKLVKLGSGIMNTHSKVADGRMETLAVCALEAGVSADLVRELLQCTSTQEAILQLEKKQAKEAVMECLLRRIKRQLDLRSGENMQTEVIVFSNEDGVLCASKEAMRMVSFFRA